MECKRMGNNTRSTFRIGTSLFIPIGFVHLSILSFFLSFLYFFRSISFYSVSIYFKSEVPILKVSPTQYVASVYTRLNLFDQLRPIFCLECTIPVNKILGKNNPHSALIPRALRYHYMEKNMLLCLALLIISPVF